jgi:hypothetical protein
MYASVLMMVDNLPRFSTCRAFIAVESLLILVGHLLAFPCFDPLSQQPCILVHGNQTKQILLKYGSHYWLTFII